MAAFAAVLVLSFGVFWLEAPKLVQRKQKRELTVFILLLFVSTTCCALLALDVKLPNPLAWMKVVFRDFV
ncbi:hypothetical protein [Brevibacillus centrosporus]|uniref:hypothetical protein n=1 Tax=Brevibacillus centrosporus TaxID=54910 RepID=UPI002E24E3C3|nr:hypothetical protein [Brevibacillus centrosporus]